MGLLRCSLAIRRQVTAEALALQLARVLLVQAARAVQVATLVILGTLELLETLVALEMVALGVRRVIAVGAATAAR